MSTSAEHDHAGRFTGAGEEAPIPGFTGKLSHVVAAGAVALAATLVVLVCATSSAMARSGPGNAHRLGLGFGLKNDLTQIKDLLPVIDFAVNEECVRYRECGAYTPLLAANKAVFHIEYDGSLRRVCGSAPRGMSSVLKNLELDASRSTCPVRTSGTQTALGVS